MKYGGDMSDGEAFPPRTVLRRTPTQRRNRAAVIRILAAAEELLVESGYDAATRSNQELIDRAQVKRGTFYTYFESSQAVMEQLTLDSLQVCKRIIDEVAEDSHVTWQEAMDAIIDAYAEFYRTPSVQEIWLHHHLTDTALAFEAGVNDYVAQRISDLIRNISGGRMRRSSLRIQVSQQLGDRLLRLAFERDPSGDPDIIAEVKIAQRAYLAASERDSV
jgi:AcrR family transcriptional regulator